MRANRLLTLLCLAAIAGLLPACSAPKRLIDPHRYQNGAVFVLPGIEGKSVWNKNIAIGLDAGGVRAAIEVYDWTSGLPGGFVYNLANLQRNRREAELLADVIVDQKKRNPGVPVHLVGHSGGGALAVLALESLPKGEEVDMVLLLAPAISPDYDLSLALSRTRHGIINFYSHKDVGLLKIGTTLFGSVDRKHGESAGAVGFVTPIGLTRAQRHQYTTRLRQVRWTEQLKRYGADGSHTGWTTRNFARQYLAPLLLVHEKRERLAPATQDEESAAPRAPRMDARYEPGEEASRHRGDPAPPHSAPDDSNASVEGHASRPD